jgi:hypothetical protein
VGIWSLESGGWFCVGVFGRKLSLLLWFLSITESGARRTEAEPASAKIMLQ